MTVDEALAIGDRLEREQAISTSAQAIRTLADALRNTPGFNPIKNDNGAVNVEQG